MGSTKSEPSSLDLLVRTRIHAALGETDEALRLLELQCDARRGNLAFLRVLPQFDPIRSDPRFVALLNKVDPDRPGTRETGQERRR